MMNLYAISENYLSIINKIQAEDGAIDQEDVHLLKELDQLHDDFAIKATNIGCFIKNLEAEHEQVKKARKEMQSREKRLAAKVDWLTSYLKMNLQRLNIHEISSSPYFVIKVKNCHVSVNIIDEGLIPGEYKKTKEVVTVDRIKLKEDLQHGLIIEGAELQQNVRLEIK